MANGTDYVCLGCPLCVLTENNDINNTFDHKQNMILISLSANFHGAFETLDHCAKLWIMHIFDAFALGQCLSGADIAFWCPEHDLKPKLT